MIINKENIEAYLLLLIDGELSAAEEAAVMAFVESNTEYQFLLDAYLDTKLEAEPIVFEGKASLLKEEWKVLPLRKNKLYMAWAAGLAAIIGIGFIFKMMTVNKPSLPNTIAVNNPAVLKKDASIQQSLVIAGTSDSLGKVSHKSHLPKIKRTTVAVLTANNNIPVGTTIDDLEPMPVADYSIAKVETSPAWAAAAVGLPNSVETADTEQGPDHTLFANSDKLELVDALVNQLEAMKDHVQEKTKSLHISAIAIRFGNKEYTIGKSFR